MAKKKVCSLVYNFLIVYIFNKILNLRIKFWPLPPGYFKVPYVLNFTHSFSASNDEHVFEIGIIYVQKVKP